MLIAVAFNIKQKKMTPNKLEKIATGNSKKLQKLDLIRDYLRELGIQVHEGIVKSAD